MMKKTVNPNKIREGSRVADFLVYALTVFVILITLYPMYYVVIMSVSDQVDVLARDVYLYPTDFQFSAYEYVMKDDALWRSLGYSAFYAIVTTVLQLFFCVTFGYALAMPKLAGRTFFVWYLIIPMYFGGGLIPTFLVMTKILGLYNSIWSIILPGATSVWYIILTRTFFYSSVPHSLREAALIDGANHYKTLFHIYLPLSKPILAVIAIYTIVNIWNSWFNASIYLMDARLHPVQMYLKSFLIDSTDASNSVAAALSPEEAEELFRATMVKSQLQYAVIVITTLPVLVVYPFLQKYFVKGVMIGAVKG